jgi:esterase/lipase
MKEKQYEPFERIVAGARVCVLMVHGFLGSPHHFDMLLPHVPAEWSIKSMQLDGHGGTLRDFRHTSRERWETQVEREIADACAAYERVVIVAHSMGCMLTANAVVKLHLEHKIAGMLFLGAALYPKCDPPIVYTAVRMINFRSEKNDPCTAAARACCGVDVYKIPLWELFASIPRFLDLFAIARYTRRHIAAYELPMIALQSYRDEVVGRRSIKPFLQNPHAKGEFLPASKHFYYSPEDTQHICRTFDGMVVQVDKNLQKMPLCD